MVAKASRWRGALAMTVAVAAGCSLNAATGRLQVTTISESEEIAMGRKVDEDVSEALGVYDHEGLSTLVSEIGQSVAKHSERPQLPWSFRVLDEAGVNAFAVPGGFIYTTRGLLVHLSSKDELAAVLGHEVGHVTARHGVVAMRKQKVAAASVGVLRVIDPQLRHVGGLAASTAGLALLKHSRDDEYEADELGVRYVGRAGFDRAATVRVFDVLTTVSELEQGQRVPSWLSTHPDPQLRRDRILQTLPAAGEAEPDPEYLDLLDGVLYGEDPRQGFIAGRSFVHIDKGFRIDFPPGWEAVCNGPRAIAQAPDEAALMVLVPSDAESAKQGLDDFFRDGSIEPGEEWTGMVGGFAVVSAGFSVSTTDGPIYGLLAFVQYGDEVIQLAAIGPSKGWEERSATIAESFASFGEAAPVLSTLDPMRVRLQTLPEAMTIEQVDERWPSVIDLPQLAALNRVSKTDTLPEGTAVKRVVGFNPARGELSKAAEAGSRR